MCVCIKWLLIQCFYESLECADEWVSVSCAVSWALFLLLICFVLTQCANFHFILFFYCPLETYLFSDESQKGSGYGREGDGKELGLQRERELTRIYYVRFKKTIFNKRKNKDKNGDLIKPKI